MCLNRQLPPHWWKILDSLTFPVMETAFITVNGLSKSFNDVQLFGKHPKDIFCPSAATYFISLWTKQLQVPVLCHNPIRKIGHDFWYIDFFVRFGGECNLIWKYLEWTCYRQYVVLHFAPKSAHGITTRTGFDPGTPNHTCILSSISLHYHLFVEYWREPAIVIIHFGCFGPIFLMYT